MKEKLVILLGPTGIGKTELSIDLAKELSGEIVSSDSMQIYKYMDIGTAKIMEDEMDGISHHLINVVSPDEEFTVEDYRNRASDVIEDINRRGKLPIVTGGTGLYINSLVYKLNFAQVPPNEEYRIKLEGLVESHGNEYLHNELRKVDKDSADRLHPNDVKRVIRAMEVYQETGKTMTDYNKDFRQPTDRYELSMVGLNMDRKKLYERINKRVDIMIEDGLVDEVKSILDKGYTRELIALEGIGYKEIIMYLEGKMSLDDSIDLIKQKSRNYAKRQLTWFRRDNRIKWFDKGDYSNYDKLKDNVIGHIKEKLKM